MRRTQSSRRPCSRLPNAKSRKTRGVPDDATGVGRRNAAADLAGCSAFPPGLALRHARHGAHQRARADRLRARRPDGERHQPWYAPDGARILFVCEKQGTVAEPPAGQNDDICAMDADGSDLVNLTNTPNAGENFPSWG